MKKLALTVALLALWAIQVVEAAEFFCPSGNVTCLISAINEANGTPGEQVITLEPGSYTLHAPNDPSNNPSNGLPVIQGSIRIQASAEDLPTVIERDPGAPLFRIFAVALGGELHLDGVTIQRGAEGAIVNGGLTSLQDSIVTDSIFNGAIRNGGTLRVLRSIISNNFGGTTDAGGILNRGTVLVENSTIANNGGTDGGGILNLGGSVVVKNSAIIFNRTDAILPGGGNVAGSVEIVNSTIAK